MRQHSDDCAAHDSYSQEAHHDRAASDGDQNWPVAPKQVDDPDNDEVDEVASKGVAGGQIGLIDEKYRADAGHQLRERRGRGQHHHAYKRPAETRPVGYDIGGRNEEARKEQDGRGGDGEGKPKQGQCHGVGFLRREKGPNRWRAGHAML